MLIKHIFLVCPASFEFDKVTLPSESFSYALCFYSLIYYQRNKHFKLHMMWTKHRTAVRIKLSAVEEKVWDVKKRSFCSNFSGKNKQFLMFAFEIKWIDHFINFDFYLSCMTTTSDVIVGTKFL